MHPHSAAVTTPCCYSRVGGRSKILDSVALESNWQQQVLATSPPVPHRWSYNCEHLVIMAVEVGGRWSEETRAFVTALAIARARSEIPLMRRRAEQAWRMRWGGMLACAVARAFASSLLDLSHSHGGDGITPASHEVDGDHRYAGLAPG